MSSLDAFFDAAVATGEPARDYKGRPMLVPRGAPAGARSPYARASSFANRVRDTEFMTRWKMRYLAIALSVPGNDDLRDLLASEPYNTHTDIDEATKRASGRRVDEAIERALDRQGILRKADRGTAIHSLTEPGNTNVIPEHFRDAVSGYDRALEAAGIVELRTEAFIACDEVMAAGTADGLYYHPSHGIVIGDKKTGSMGPEFAVQLAIYSHGEFYDGQNDTRQAIDEWARGDHDETYNPDVGLIFSVQNKGTTIYEIDLAKGWEIAKAIHMIGESLTNSIYSLAHAAPKPDPLIGRITAAQTVSQLEAIFRQAGGLWESKHTELAQARRAQIEEPHSKAAEVAAGYLNWDTRPKPAPSTNPVQAIFDEFA